ncbi:unnamed protein product [Peniophora sp. CBMAI 1063]|nr:unnamed protein product [Peniophora sp. CBMAI 1063]
MPASAWLEQPSERRLRELSNLVASGAPYSTELAATIAADVETLRDLTFKFLRYLNAYTSPILRLPPEVMQEIFAHVTEQSAAFDGRAGWMRLGQVSHDFRSTLHSMRGLWAKVACNGVFWGQEEPLARAGDLPLTLRLCNQGDYIHPSRVDFVANKLARARSLFIYEQEDGILWNRDPKSISGAELPHLQNLHIHAKYRPTRDITWLPRSAYELEPVHAPLLRKVFLVNIFVPFPPGNLTSLTLSRASESRNLAIPDDHLPQPDAFLEMLRRCTKVEILCLEHIIPILHPASNKSYDHSNHDDRIQLPSLRKITLNSSRTRITSLWTHLSLPENVHVDIGVDYINDDDGGGATSDAYIDQERCSFLALFSHYFTHKIGAAACALAIELNTEKSITRCGFFKRVPEICADVDEGLPVVNLADEVNDAYTLLFDVWFYRCKWAEGHAPLAQFIESIPRTYLAHINNLDLTGLGVDDLRLLLPRLPRLHTISIFGPLTLPPLAALMPALPAGGGSTACVPVPELRHLRLVGILLLDGEKYMGNSWMLPCTDVIDLVTSRADAGCPLHSLKLIKIRSANFWEQALMDDFVHQLSQLVKEAEGSVWWSGLRRRSRVL